MEDHKLFLSRCQKLGQQAFAAGESPAGSLIVHYGRIISEAPEATKTKKDITCHSEIEAIRIATKELNTNDLTGCILYTNYEPCVMCAYVIRYHRISTVIYQHEIPFLGGISSPLSVLTTTQVPAHWSSPPEIIHIPGMRVAH